MTTEELLKPRWKVIADFPGSLLSIGEILTNLKYHQEPDDYSIRIQTELGELGIFPSEFPAVFKELEWWQERDEKDMPKYVRYKGCEMFRLNSPKMGEVLKVDNYQEDYLNHNKGCDWISLYEPATEQEYLNQ